MIAPAMIGAHFGKARASSAERNLAALAARRTQRAGEPRGDCNRQSLCRLAALSAGPEALGGACSVSPARAP